MPLHEALIFVVCPRALATLLFAGVPLLHQVAFFELYRLAFFSGFNLGVTLLRVTSVAGVSFFVTSVGDCASCIFVTSVADCASCMFVTSVAD